MITIDIPMEPSNSLFPNKRHRRGGYFAGVAASTECRQTARYAAMASGPYLEPYPGAVALTIHAGYGYRRQKPDLDATISACKPFIDGLVDAGILIDDNQVVKITATHEKLKGKRGEKLQGFTRIVIEELTPQNATFTHTREEIEQ